MAAEQVQKEVGRPKWPKSEEKTREEEELQHTLEETAREDEERRTKEDSSFPGTREETKKYLAPLARPAPAGIEDLEIVISEDRVKRSFELARVLADVVMTRMDRGIHYGIIPGTQGESLWDPGAATLMNVSRTRTRYEVLRVREEDDGHVVIFVGCDLVYWPSEAGGQSGVVVASGVGAASSHETKYAYRWVQESDVPAGLDKAALKTRPRDRSVQYRIPNPDLGDLWNTLFKMAAKRADVDAAQHLPGVSEALARIRRKGN
jgi:hypothetical protein